MLRRDTPFNFVSRQPLYSTLFTFLVDLNERSKKKNSQFNEKIRIFRVFVLPTNWNGLKFNKIPNPFRIQVELRGKYSTRD